MADFGARLREARERRGIPLRRIAEHTKISITALEAIERSDASRLPGGIFARSFVRSYASEVGLDPEATVEEFLDRFGGDARFAVMSTTAPEPPVPAAPALPGILLKLLVVGLVAVVILLYFTMVRHPSDRAADPRPDAGRRTSRRLALAAVPKPARLP